MPAQVPYIHILELAPKELAKRAFTEADLVIQEAE